MEVTHDDIARYIKFMKSRRYWDSTEDMKSLSYYDLFKKFYYHSRPVLFFISFIVNVIGLYFTEGMGLLDGSFLFVPLSIAKVVLTSITYAQRRHHKNLAMSLNKLFNEHNEIWMITTRKKYTTRVWKFVNFVVVYQYSLAFTYALAPLIADTILHYVFDYLSSPFFMPLSFTPFLGSNITWDVSYYSTIAVSIWASWEVVENLQGFIVGYSVTTVFTLVELVIFREMIVSLNFEGPIKETDRQLRMIVSSHNDIIELNKDLKAFLGLPCAFQSLFTSFTLTLTLFTTFTSPSIPVVLGYASGFIFYLSAGLLYCSLGQLLENESDEIYTALYNLPWYRCSPDVRKSLNMMMRQSHTPLIIDYHGGYTMNFENFMQICRSAYSYFTLLQSVTG